MNSTTLNLAVTFDDVQVAARRLAGVAHRTPVLTSRTLDDRVGANVYLKAEIFQRMGAFKFRGAYNAVASLGEAARSRGVVAFSSGNHAQAVALAAKLHGIPAVIVMPSDAPPAKLAATRGYGAEVRLYDRYTESRDALAKQIAEERGSSLIPPYDHPMVIAGQGTCGLELIEQVPQLDLVAVCTGGGGLLAGCATAIKHVSNRVSIWGVEPAAGDDWAQTWSTGKRVTLTEVPRTIADGQQTMAPGELTLPIARQYVDGFATVTDEEIAATVAFLFERLRIVVEPSGASALAAVMSGKLDVAGKRVGVTLSGGNVGFAQFAEIMSKFDLAPAVTFS